jgi:hypothetical protein
MLLPREPFRTPYETHGGCCGPGVLSPERSRGRSIAAMKWVLAKADLNVAL